MNLAAKDNRASLKEDILVLQECSTVQIFSTVSKLFVRKWELKEFSFIKYFKKQWLSSKRNGWYQGYAFGIPDHNNANEADNRYIKEGDYILIWLYIYCNYLLNIDIIFQIKIDRDLGLFSS